jgi:ketosteroid isomerase-like protein
MGLSAHFSGGCHDRVGALDASSMNQVTRLSRRWFLVASSIVLAGVACASNKRLNPAERREIEGVFERQCLAWNRGDLAGYMDGYARTPALTFTSAGKIRRGWDETFAAYQKRYGGDRAGMGQLAFDLLDVTGVGAGAAVVLGRWRLTETPQAGSGVFSVILEQGPEGWRIVHDHTSSDPKESGSVP